MRRRVLLSGLALLPGPVLAQETPPRPRRRLDPLPIPPPPPPAPLQTDVRGDLAPVPNRSIEAPRDPYAGPAGPRLEPALIDRPDERRGFTFGREHLNERDGRLFNDIAPGARLRIPLE